MSFRCDTRVNGVAEWTSEIFALAKISDFHHASMEAQNLRARFSRGDLTIARDETLLFSYAKERSEYNEWGKYRNVSMIGHLKQFRWSINMLCFHIEQWINDQLLSSLAVFCVLNRTNSFLSFEASFFVSKTAIIFATSHYRDSVIYSVMCDSLFFYDGWKCRSESSAWSRLILVGIRSETTVGGLRPRRHGSAGPK